MEANEAVPAAKRHFAALFPEQPSLEEIWFDHLNGNWCVTLGVRRPLTSGGGMNVLTFSAYKVVRIDPKDGSLISIKNRENEHAA